MRGSRQRWKESAKDPLAVAAAKKTGRPEASTQKAAALPSLHHGPWFHSLFSCVVSGIRPCQCERLTFGCTKEVAEDVAAKSGRA